MISVKKKYEHFINIPTEICLFKQNPEYHLYVVYFINCQINPNYFDWLMKQIYMIKDFDASVYIIATIEESKQKEFIEDTLLLFPGVNIECHIENEFEYRAILKVWKLGQIHNESNDIILYFHSKGMSHHASYKDNAYDDSSHDYVTILHDYEKIKEIFTIFPKIDKIGYFAGGCGWIWFNFWYARGSYINMVEMPIKTLRRHYYEDWLARKVDSELDRLCDNERCNQTYYKNTLESCYGFYTDGETVGNIGNYYCPIDNTFYPIYP
jgi:hypothetical protein